MTRRGLFITVEGGEGVGKSTNLAFIEQQLHERGIHVVRSREPGGSALGDQLRSLLLDVRDDEIVPMAELLMMFAARAQHVQTLIEPTLEKGHWVLCDRFTDATYAYQCGGRGIAHSIVQNLESTVQQTLRPDLTLLLDAPIETGMARAKKRGQLDRMEQEELVFFQRVRAKYLEMAEQEPQRYRVVDASMPLDSVQDALAEICEQSVRSWREGQMPQ
ncbi:MAG: dTMP kinase [Pseudomonadota bacterium]